MSNPMMQTEQATELALRITQESIDRSTNAEYLALLRRIDRYLDSHPTSGVRLDLRQAIKRACR